MIKKLTAASILLISLFASVSSFGYINKKSAADEKKIYCPETITCTETGNIDSCMLKSDELQYWNLQGTIIAEKYTFYHGVSGYHSELPVVCSYSGGGGYLTLFAKAESNLEGYYDKTTQWVNNGSQLICASNNPATCPLKEASGLRVSFTEQGSNDTIHLFTDGSSFYSNRNTEFFIRYENAGVCLNKKECKIDFYLYNVTATQIGSIVVDMDHKMKVINLSPKPSSGFGIKKLEPFNTIEIIKAELPPNISSVQVINLTLSDMFLSANNTYILKVNANSHGNLVSNGMMDACKDQRECKIDIKTSNNGQVGTVLLDMENDMRILCVQSTRSSEIRLNEVDPHKIEISYPNKK